MFYSQFILAKKGPLGTIWIAAHLERKLRKNQVTDTDIGVSVDSILFPEMPIALRLSSHLLLGVVRIYSRKVNYLFDDCSEALLKVKQAFRSTAVDLLPEEATAPYHSITMPETFDLDDFQLPDCDIFQGNYVDHHISSKEQITLQDTMAGVVFSTSKFGLDERFGDDDASGLDLDEELLLEKAATEDNRDAMTTPEAMPADDIVNQQMEEYDGDSDPVEYAQAPCTPGLWEEPSFSNILETSACDDHHEPENQTVTEFEPREKSPPHIVETEHMSIDDLVSTPFTESVISDRVTSVSEAVIVVSDDPVEVEDLLNKNADNEETGALTVDDNHKNHVEYQGNHDNSRQLTTELESNTEPISEPNDSTFSVQSPHDIMPSSNPPILRPCVTLPEDVPHARETPDKNSPDIHLAEISQNSDVQLASTISNRQVDSVIESNVQVGNIDSYNDYSAPEKLLSLPHGFSDVTKDFLAEATPIEKDIVISGKKRSFAESSLTGQSLDLNESSGFFTTNTTRESVMNDDDLLSSILVGRKSSILKMKPSPPVEAPSTKRRRSAPKTGISKRKVVMDDNMVLHGDTIRQQLTNTEDIRRLRKKAPCTRFEISMLEKQFWEDELFSEPVFSGVSIKLASLHNQSYDLTKIIVSDAPIENVTNSESISRNDEIGPNVCEVQPIEFPFGTHNQSFDNNTTSLVSVMSVEVENPTHENVVPSDTSATLAEVENTTQIDADMDNIGSGIKEISEEKHDQDVEISKNEKEVVNDDVALDLNVESNAQNLVYNGIFGDTSAMEIDVGVSVMPIEVEKSTHVNVVPSDTSPTLGEDASLQTNDKIDLLSADVDNIESNIKEISEEKHDKDFEISKSEEKVVNDDMSLDLNVESNAQNLVYNGIFGFEVNPVLENVSLDKSENPGHHVTFSTNVQDLLANNRIDDDQFTYSAVENDTDFLNFDDVDDDVAEAGDDYTADVEKTRVIDNSGWSSRTKAVAKYLQIMFDKEGERGRNMLPVNNLLAGKTRKEASRMFFETLVLKTKDYIHVEQADPFENINIFPRAKLLKSDF